ncbi:MAG TPA: hypothetical protein PKY82_23515 [Pyrinomonadaceae bacterium]|nr:hypothetical protein [Pyrinomonadaceae bacterium]
MEWKFLLSLFKFLWFVFVIVRYFQQRQKEKTFNAEIVKRLELLENKKKVKKKLKP